MSEATDKLAETRRAILDFVHRGERHHDPHEEGQAPEWPRHMPDEPPPRGSGWFGRVRHALHMWWRYHPAHMAVEVATPVLGAYARAKPAQVLGFAALAGAALVFARPWRLISLTTILVAVLKSSHLPGVLLSALSAADFEKDHRNPR